MLRSVYKNGILSQYFRQKIFESMNEDIRSYKLKNEPIRVNGGNEKIFSVSLSNVSFDT